MSRMSRFTTAAALAGVLAAALATLPNPSAAEAKSLAVQPPGLPGVASVPDQAHTSPSVVDLDQPDADVPALNDIKAVDADADWLFALVMGVTELRDERIMRGFTVYDPVATADGSGLTGTVPTDPEYSVTITPADGEKLDIGVYDAATAGEPGSGQVGLTVEGLGDVCTQAPAGQIAIQDVAYQDGVLETLAEVCLS